MKLSRYAEGFYTCLEHVQATRPDLIEPDIDVRKDYGLSRSSRHSVTTHARNIGIPEGVIQANNRWQKEESACGG